MTLKYVGEFTIPLKNDRDERIATLIWGDPVHVLDESAGFMKVWARAREGWVDRVALSDRSLLEIYVIDVGQGDGILLKTPEGNWHVIDAGVAGRDQMTKKGTANFLRWKFLKDLREEKVSLTNVILTHPDYDHYGGLLDVLSGELADGRKFGIEVENFYHSCLGRFKRSPKLGQRVNGRVGPFPNGYHGIRRRGSFITELFDGKDSFANPPRELDDTFGELAALVSQVPHHVRRISHQDHFLPGFRPGEAELTIRVLGPILERFGTGLDGLRWLGSQGVTRNGHSVILRLDYRQARILLTGDLNAKSQRLLFSYRPETEFAADVAKGCHHGSADVDLDFFRAMKARATVISSGDNENYAHPQPVVLGASARYGREAISPSGELLPPLVYSTELARSVKLAYASAVRVDLDKDPETPSRRVYPRYAEVKPQGSNARYRPLRYTPLSTDLVYGLVNVRTDGVHILCATMEEKGNDFDVTIFKAGAEA